MSEGRLVVASPTLPSCLESRGGWRTSWRERASCPSLRLGRRLVVPRAALLTWLDRAARPDSRDGRKERW